MRVNGIGRGVLALLLMSTTAWAAPRLTVSSKTPKAGDPVLVSVTGVDARPRGTGGKVTLVFFPVRDGWQAVFAVPHEDPPAELEVKVGELSEKLTVHAVDLPQEQVTVEPDMAEPPPGREKQIASDNGAILAAARNDVAPLWTGAFRLPTGSVTSGFGAVRLLNEAYHSHHLGTDFAARVGQPVRAVARGKVALVLDDGFLVGGTVVIVHGAGIASIHFHMSDFAVKVGDDVERGAVLGKVSLTGRTTGPHIHVGIWVPGGFVDPLVFARLKLGVSTAAETATAR